MSNQYFAVSPDGTEYQMSRMIAENHKMLMIQAGERGWMYGTREEINQLRGISSNQVNKNVELASKDMRILELERQLAEMKASAVAEEEKFVPETETPMNANVIIGFIKSAITIEEVNRYTHNEKRPSVLKAAAKRVAELGN